MSPENKVPWKFQKPLNENWKINQKKYLITKSETYLQINRQNAKEKSLENKSGQKDNLDKRGFTMIIDNISRLK